MGYWKAINQAIDEKAVDSLQAEDWKTKLSLWDRGELLYGNLPDEVQQIVEDLMEMYENIAAAQREERSIGV